METMKSRLPELRLKKIQTNFPNAKIETSADCAKFIRQFYLDDIEIYESFFILMMNRNNRTTGFAKISQGGITGTVVDVRIIAKYAVESLACSVILAHNHPSGNTMPSKADKDLTRRIKEALKLFDCAVLDHVILTAEDGYFSFADEGLM